MRILESISARVNQVFVWIAGSAMVLIMLFAVTNMFLRPLHTPFGATAEVITFLAAITAAFSLGYSQTHKAHVDIDLLVSRLSPRVGALLESITLFLSIVLFAVITWQLWLFAARQGAAGVLSDTLRFPYFYLIYATSIAFASLVVVLIIDFCKSVCGRGRK